MNNRALFFIFMMLPIVCLSQTNLTFRQIPNSHIPYRIGLHPDICHCYKNKLFFGGYEDPAVQLWVTDGTNSGTMKVKDIWKYNSQPHYFAEINGLMTFVATTGDGDEPWVTDGTGAGTYMLKDINPGGVDSRPTGFTKLGNTLLFSAYNVTDGNELWTTDGTTGGTYMLKDMSKYSSDPHSFTEYNGRLYFNASSDSAYVELFVTDGTIQGTQLFADIDSGKGYGSKPQAFIEMGGKLYFMATTRQYGIELWVTDGTLQGTHIVKDINPGDKDGLSSYSGYYTKFIVFNNKLYFNATDGYTNGVELWCSDGTNSGTYMIKDIAPGYVSSISYSHLVVFNNKLYFTANDGVHGKELWVTDGTAAGTHVAVDFNPGQVGSDPTYPIVYGRYMYMRCEDANSRHVLVQSDGTQSGTKVVSPPGAAGKDPLLHQQGFVICNNILYFTANYQDTGYVTWALIDPTVAAISTQNENAEFRIYPNPNKGVFTLECNFKELNNCSVSIFDISGKEVFSEVISEKKSLLNMTELTSGIYVVKVKNNNQEYTSSLHKN